MGYWNSLLMSDGHSSCCYELSDLYQRRIALHRQQLSAQWKLIWKKKFIFRHERQSCWHQFFDMFLCVLSSVHKHWCKVFIMSGKTSSCGVFRSDCRIFIKSLLNCKHLKTCRDAWHLRSHECCEHESIQNQISVHEVNMGGNRSGRYGQNPLPSRAATSF